MNRIPRTLAILSLLAVAACQTVEGAGEDLQSAGTVISREAREASK